jgi:hypothetical protein
MNYDNRQRSAEAAVLEFGWIQSRWERTDGGPTDLKEAQEPFHYNDSCNQDGQKGNGIHSLSARAYFSARLEKLHVVRRS